MQDRNIGIDIWSATLCTKTSPWQLLQLCGAGESGTFFRWMCTLDLFDNFFWSPQPHLAHEQSLALVQPCVHTTRDGCIGVFFLMKKCIQFLNYPIDLENTRKQIFSESHSILLRGAYSQESSLTVGLLVNFHQHLSSQLIEQDI